MAWSPELPIIHVSPDPTWSQNFLDFFNMLINHTHSGADDDGYKIDLNDMNILEAFSLLGFDIKEMRSVIFQNLNFDPENPDDLNSLYFKDGNLWLNNGSGQHVQVSNGAGLNQTTGVANAEALQAVTTNLAIANTNTNIYFYIDTGSPRTITLPAISTVTAGRFYFFKDATGQSETNNVTFAPTGADTIDGAANYVLARDYAAFKLTSDGNSNWMLAPFSTKDYLNALFEHDTEINFVSPLVNVKGDVVVVGEDNTDLLQVKAESQFDEDVEMLSQLVLQDQLVVNGLVVLNDDGNVVNGTILFNDNATFQGDTTTIGGSSSDDLVVNATTVFNNGVQLGSNSSDAITGAGTLTQNAPATFNGNVTIGNAATDTLSVIAAAEFDADITLGSGSGDALAVNATSNFNSPVTFNHNTTIGNAGSDSLTVIATTSFEDDVTFNDNAVFNDPIEGTLFEVDCPARFDSAEVNFTNFVNFNGETTFTSDMIALGNVHFGNTSSDTFTIVSNTSWSSVGRPRFNSSVVSSPTTVNVQTTKFIYIAPGFGTDNLATTAASPATGDWCFITNVGGGVVTFTGALAGFTQGASTASTINSNTFSLFVYISGTWYRLLRGQYTG